MLGSTGLETIKGLGTVMESQLETHVSSLSHPNTLKVLPLLKKNLFLITFLLTFKDPIMLRLDKHSGFYLSTNFFSKQTNLLYYTDDLHL